MEVVVVAVAVAVGAGIAATAVGSALKLVGLLAVLGAKTAAVTGVGVDVGGGAGAGVAVVSAGLPIIWRMACKKTLLSGMVPTTPSGSKT